MAVDWTLNDWAELQSSASTRDAAGGEVMAWSTTRSIWCRVEDVTAREYLAADEPQAARVAKVHGYWDDLEDVTAAMRLIVGSRTLAVTGVLRSPGGRAVVMCAEMTT